MNKLLFGIVILFSITTVSAQQRTLSEAISEHLSYLGYSTSRAKNTISAKHHIKPGFDILVVNNGVLFRAWFQHKEFPENRKGEYISAVNSLNINSTVAKFYVDQELDLIIEGWYPLPYNKKSFSNFVATWEHDFSKILQQSSALLKDFLS